MATKTHNIIKEVKEERFKNNCFLAVTYFINESKKIIVCKLEPYVNDLDLDDVIDKYNIESLRTSLDVVSTRSFFNNFYMNNISVIGKAVCIEPDEFDIEFGKKIAYDKAMFKLLDLKNRHYKKDILLLDTFKEEITKCIEDTNKQINKVTERYTKKLKEVSL